MKRNRGKNPVYILACMVVPWRFLHTYYAKEEDSLVLSRYCAETKSNSFKRQTDVITLKKIVQIGFEGDFDLKRAESIKTGKYGSYKSQECLFLLDDGAVVGWNVRPYTKKQVIDLLGEIDTKYTVQLGEKLRSALSLNEDQKEGVAK